MFDSKPRHVLSVPLSPAVCRSQMSRLPLCLAGDPSALSTCKPEPNQGIQYVPLIALSAMLTELTSRWTRFSYGFSLTLTVLAYDFSFSHVF